MPTRAIRVLALWADQHSANLGVRALAAGTGEIARRAWGAETIVEYQDFAGTQTGVGFGPRDVLRDFGRRSGAIKRHLHDFDVVFDTGAGDSFADIYGLKRIVNMFYVQRATWVARKPLVLGPQTIGPFETRFGRMAASRVLHKADQVFARDSESFEFSAASLGQRPDATATDVVFALKAPAAADDYDVLLNVSGLLWQPNPHVNYLNYRAGSSTS